MVSEQSPSPEQMTIRNLTASGGEPGTITIHWEPPLTWTQGYDIAWADRAGDNASRGSRRIYQLDDGGKLSHTLAGLVPGETYKIRVRATYSAGMGPWQEVSSRAGGFQQQRAVTGLTVTDFRFLEAKVNWNQPSEAPIGYDLFSNPTRGTTANPDPFQTVGPKFIYVPPGEHTFWVRARYHGGYGPWSSAVRYTMRTRAYFQSIKNFTVSSDGPGTITASWVKPITSPIKYKLRYARIDTDRWNSSYPSSESASHTLTGLEEGKEYLVRLEGHDIRDSISHSTPAEVRIRVASAPTATPPPASTPGPAPTPTPRNTPTPEPNPGQVENLSAVVSVRISDDNPQTSAGLQRFMSRSANESIDAVSVASGASDEVVRESDRSVINHDNSVILSWDAPSSGPRPDGYRVYRSKYTISVVTESEVLSEDTGGRGTTFTDNTAESLTFYGYYVSALRGDIEGERSNEIRLTTNPVANTPTSPLNVSATQNGDGDVVVTWDEPAYAPVKPCTYDVYRDPLVSASDLSERTYTDTALEPDTVYGYGVWATCGGYKGSHSSGFIRTDTRESDIPHKPGVFTGSYDSDTNGIRLLWYTKVNPEDPDDPSNRGDPSVTAFVISRTVTQSKVPSLEEAFPDVTVQATEADAQGVLEYVDTKVIEGSGYTYEFRSKNASGLSDPVLLGREARRVTGRAAGITNLRVTDKRIGAITLEWDAPDQSGDNPAITGYKIHRNIGSWLSDDVVVLESNLAATATSYVDTSEGLRTFWWDYTYYVTPFNAVGHSRFADIRFTALLPSDDESPDDETPGAPVLGTR